MGEEWRADRRRYQERMTHRKKKAKPSFDTVYVETPRGEPNVDVNKFASPRMLNVK